MTSGPLARRRLSVRLRLTAWYMTAMLAVLAVYAACLLFALQRANSHDLDDRLRGDFRWAAEMAEQRPDGSLTWFDSSADDEDLPWLQVWGRDGRLLFKTAAVERLPIQDSRRLASSADNSIIVVPQAIPMRVLSGVSKIAGQPVVIQVARSEGPLRRSLRDMIVTLLVSLPLAVAVAGAGGYSLARRALAPVGRLAERARAMTADRLAERLPAENPDDELGQLTAFINEMLARLENSFTQMRRFTADVSHQVRTPLAALRTEAEVALRGPRDASAYRAVLSSMLEEVDRLGSLVDQLLALSRAESGHAGLSAEVVDLAPLANQVLNHLAVLAEEKQQTLTLCPEAAPRCRGDKGALRQALINLIDNAIKYTPEGGKITVTVTEQDDHAIVEVMDTGRGVAPDEADRIFDRFYRGAPVSRHANGFGLGLAIAKLAAEVNGGRLLLRRNPAGGSTFRLELPIVAAA